MKWYIELTLILEVESWDLEDNIWMIEDFVFDEMDDATIHKDIKVVEKSINALGFNQWIEDWFEHLFI